MCIPLYLNTRSEDHISLQNQVRQTLLKTGYNRSEIGICYDIITCRLVVTTKIPGVKTMANYFLSL